MIPVPSMQSDRNEKKVLVNQEGRALERVVLMVASSEKCQKFSFFRVTGFAEGKSRYRVDACPVGEIGTFRSNASVVCRRELFRRETGQALDIGRESRTTLTVRVKLAG
jgi:hypothetical protein